MIIDAVRHRALGRHGLALLLALAMLLPAVPPSVAQDAVGETDIEIVVHPSESRPGGSIGSNGSDQGATASATNVVLLPGTVSARFVLIRENDLTERDDDLVMIVVVRDDRGTAAGWDVTSYYEAVTDTARPPALLENRDATIRRVLPEDGRLSDQINQLRAGRTLGLLDPMVPILHASPGSGTGVFLQQVIVVPLPAAGDEAPGTVIVHLPFAP